MDYDARGAFADACVEGLPDSGLGQLHVAVFHNVEAAISRLHETGHLGEHVVGLADGAPVINDYERFFVHFSFRRPECRPDEYAVRTLSAVYGVEPDGFENYLGCPVEFFEHEMLVNGVELVHARSEVYALDAHFVKKISVASAAARMGAYRVSEVAHGARHELSGD